MLTFESTVIDGISVLSPKGELKGDADNHKLHNAVLRLIETDAPAIILDLQNVKFMISAGLGLIISEYKKARDKGIKLMLANLPEQVRDLLLITRLETHLIDYGTLENAIAVATRQSDTNENPVTE